MILIVYIQGTNNQNSFHGAINGASQPRQFKTESLAAGHSTKNQLYVRDPRVHEKCQDAGLDRTNVEKHPPNAGERAEYLKGVQKGSEFQHLTW
jgi:hypothetical protein